MARDVLPFAANAAAHHWLPIVLRKRNLAHSPISSQLRGVYLVDAAPIAYFTIQLPVISGRSAGATSRPACRAVGLTWQVGIDTVCMRLLARSIADNIDVGTKNACSQLSGLQAKKLKKPCIPRPFRTIVNLQLPLFTLSSPLLPGAFPSLPFGFFFSLPCL